MGLARTLLELRPVFRRCLCGVVSGPQDDTRWAAAGLLYWLNLVVAVAIALVAIASAIGMSISNTLMRNKLHGNTGSEPKRPAPRRSDDLRSDE